MNDTSDLESPEGRFAASQALGHDGYNDAMKAHIGASCVEVVNGYGIRPVTSRFGRLFAIVGTEVAFSTIEAAREHASKLEGA